MSGYTLIYNRVTSTLSIPYCVWLSLYIRTKITCKEVRTKLTRHRTIEERKKCTPHKTMEEFRNQAGIRKVLEYQKTETPEQREARFQKMRETRQKNKQEKMFLEKCMRTLLYMDTKSEARRAVLKKFGFDNDYSNKTLLMVALFQKAITGDVQAIKEIRNMMTDLGIHDETGKYFNNQITINLLQQGESYLPTESEEEEIWKVENDEEDWLKEVDEAEEWGDEIYNP